MNSITLKEMVQNEGYGGNLSLLQGKENYFNVSWTAICLRTQENTLKYDQVCYYVLVGSQEDADRLLSATLEATLPPSLSWVDVFLHTGM